MACRHGYGWRRSSWPAKITARSLGADCCCLPDVGHAQDFAFSRGLIRNGNCGICAGHAPWRLQPPGSAWPSAGKSGKPTLEAPNYGPVGGSVDARPAVTVPGTVSQGTQPPNAPDCQIVNGAVGCGNRYISGQAYGSQLYFSNGTTATRYGDRTYFGNSYISGQSYGQLYFSNGITGTTYGNTIFLSNGKTCQQYGGQLNCN
jgi:hypothetical protein